MPVERAADHPTFEIGGNAVTSFAAPARGADEAALFQIELPAGGGLPPHRHDHFDVFTVTAGGGTVYLGDEASTLAAGDSCVVPPDAAPLGGSRARRRDDRRHDARRHEADPRGRRHRRRSALGVADGGAAVLHRRRHPVRRCARPPSRRRARRGRPRRVESAPTRARRARRRPARAIDGAGKTLTPGSDRLSRPSELRRRARISQPTEAASLRGRGPARACRNLRKHLAAGVTTVRDLGGVGTCELAAAVEEGVVPGPRVVAAGRALTITGGHGHNLGIAREVDGADDARKAVREQIKGGARAIKVIATGGVLTPGIDATFTAMTPEEIGAAVDEAHKWGVGVAAHAIGGPGIAGAVRAGVDSVEHCVQLDAATAQGDGRAGHLPRPDALSRSVGDRRGRRRAGLREGQGDGAARRRPARAARGAARRRVATCARPTRARRSIHTATPRNEIARMVEWGMRPLDALVAATAHGAALLRVPDVGSVAAGFLADLVLYDERSARGRRGAPFAAAPSGRAGSRSSGPASPVRSARRRGAISASSSLVRPASPSASVRTRCRRPFVRIRLPVAVGSTSTPRASAGSGRRRTKPSRSRPSTRRVIVGAATPSAAASAPIPMGPAKTTTESADSRGGETPRASSSVRRRRNRCRAAEWSRSATASTSRVGEVRLDALISVCLIYLLSLSKYKL